jgi:hypothetical protein
MPHKTSAVLAASLATLLLALATSGAAARNLSISNQSIRATFNNIELISEGLSTISCHVTLEGSFHGRSIIKASGALIGYVTRMTPGNCNKSITVLTATLPWHVQYEGFSGTLPNITLLIVRLSNFSFQWEAGLGVRCLARTELRLRFIRSITTTELTSAEIPLQSLPLTGTFCPSTGSFRSATNGAVTLLNSTTRVSVRLI